MMREKELYDVTPHDHECEDCRKARLNSESSETDFDNVSGSGTPGFLLSVQESDTPSPLISIFCNVFEASLNQPKFSPLMIFMIQAGMLLLAVVGSWNYVPAARQYVDEDGSLLALKDEYPNLVAVVLLSTSILLNSMQIFLDYTREKNIPEKIHRYFSKDIERRTRITNASLIPVSLASSIPLGITYIEYAKDPLPVEISLAIVIFFANTIMHFLPFILLADDPIYGWPLTLIAFLWMLLKTPFTEKVNKTQEQIRNETKVKNVVVLLQKASMHIRETFEEEVEKSLIFYQAVEHRDNYNIYNLNLTEKLYSSYLSGNLATLMKPDEEEAGSPEISEISEELDLSAQIADPWWKSVSRTFGRVWVGSSCLSYAITPFTTFINLTGSTAVGVLISVLPAYLYGVLLCFFGEHTALDIITAAVTLIKGKDPSSPEVKLFPCYFLLIMITAVFCGLGSYVAAVEVNGDNLQVIHAEKALDFFNWMSVTALFAVSLFCGKDFHRWTVRKYMEYSPNKHQSALELMRQGVEMTCRRITYLKPEFMIESIEACDDDREFQTWFGMSADQVKWELNRPAKKSSYNFSLFSRIKSYFGESRDKFVQLHDNNLPATQEVRPAFT